MDSLPGTTVNGVPFRIFALALDTTLGDFTSRLIFASSVKLMFAHAELTIYYHGDRPYKPFLMDCLPVSGQIGVAPDRSIPLDYFNNAFDGYHKAPVAWMEAGITFPDLLLTPSMMPANAIPAFEQIARLRIPDEQCEGLENELTALGLDRNHWFAVMHYREPGYEFRPDRPMRDLDPADFLALRDYVIDGLGGQVVRLGHPQMTPWPERDGFVDLSAASFPLQCFASSRARFALTTPTGPSSITSGFGTPTGQTNTVERFAIYHDHDRILPKRVFDETGKRLSLAELMPVLSESQLRPLQENGWRVLPNTREELFAMADMMHRETSGAWREQPPEQRPIPTPLVWPMRPHQREKYVEF